MYKILYKQTLSEAIFRIDVEAPFIAKNRRPGNFVVVRTHDAGERIPLTIVDSDNEKGTITLIIQAIGNSTQKLKMLQEGDSILDVMGPLGQETHIEKVGTVLCCAGGLGAAPLLPIAKAFKEAGNKVITVMAARSESLLILQPEFAQCSDEVIIMTDDGSCGCKGLVTQGMEQVISREPVHLAVVIGPPNMMKFSALVTQKYNIPTVASLNTLMVDGTGMCGACRVTVGGVTRFVCVDGPEFDAHQVNFDEMINRLNSYKDHEQCKLQ